MKRKNLILFLVMFFTFIINVDAAFMRDYEVKHTNPNGKEVTIYLTGDEYFRYAHDKNGYVLIKNEEGYYTYATLNNGIVVSSNNIYDMKNTPSNKITKDDIDLTKNTQFIHHFDDKNTTKYSFKAKNKWTQKDGTAADVLEFNNTVIFIRFKGESEFINTTFTNNLKHVLGTTNTDSTGLKSYVYKVTEGHVNINNTVLQTKGTSYYSYESNRTREYLQYKSSSNTIGYSTETEGNQRLLEVLNAALSAMPAASASVLDGDGDGVIDNVIFIASGSPDGWDDALWPHKWSLNAYGGAVTFSGVKGGTYNLQFARDLLTTDSSTISKEVAVFSHETMHSLGLPDLYRYYDSTYDGDPVYKWDMMNYDQEGTYVNTAIRNRYGFTKINNDTWSREPRTITESGEYQLNLASLNTGNTSYRINTTDSKQYIQLEYRGQNGIYDSKIPYSGLLISRINTNYKGNAGTSSTPIQDEYYIFRPGETSIKAAAGDVANAALKPCTVLTGCNVSFGNQSSSASITNKAIVLTSGTNTKIYIKDVYKNTNSSVKFKVFLNGDKAYLNITEYTGSMGDTFKITPEYAETVYTPTYLSLNPETATVDQNGNVALVGPGSTTIKVTISGTVYQTVVYSNPYGLRTFTGRLLSPNQIRLDYGVTGTGIDEYVIYRSEGTSDDFTEIGRVTTPYYTDSTFVFGRTYTYKVSAVASGEEYVFDQTVTVDSSSYLPETVSGITFITTSKSSATLNFNPTQNADGYNIYTSDNIIGPYVLLDTAVSNTYDFTNLDIAKNYFIKVAAYREFGGQKYEGTRSDAIVINTREYLLNPPLIRSAEVISNNQIRITFSSIETATGYNVWVSTDNKTYTK